MGGGRPVRRSKRLGSGWTLLEWGVNHGFTINMLTGGMRLRRVTTWVGHGETSAGAA